MYLITNRKLTKAKNLNFFGKTPNSEGPNELRLVSVEKSGKDWKVKPIIDQLPTATVEELKLKYMLDIDTENPWHGSLMVACELFERARTEKKSILFFVHGYNNDVADVLKAAHKIESLYNVIVVPFTWPANGGGALSGTAAYLSDKSDARVSAGALNRAIGKIQQMHLLLTRSLQQRHQAAALKKHPDNPNAAASLFTRLMETDCSVTINLLCHSMGNYVLKHSFSTSENVTSELVFDNVCLVAADTNNESHIQWVGKLDVRKRIYVVINENDSALKASRIKPGKQQKARLGHYLKQLNSPNATYIDVTDVKHIGSEHTYFKGVAVQKSAKLKALFSGMFNGESVEHTLSYHADINTYRL
ncbi:MAG: alpha/beta hydrolase [Candidatus Electrothrix sp. YB6]